jgi:hypothetical protein
VWIVNMHNYFFLEQMFVGGVGWTEGGSGEVRSKMAAAARGPCCHDFYLDSPDDELGISNPTARMDRSDSIRFRIRKGSAADTASRRGPVVSAL